MWDEATAGAGDDAQDARSGTRVCPETGAGAVTPGSQAPPALASVPERAAG